MNSYSYELKREVAKVAPSGADESLSELSAIIKTCGEISKKQNRFEIILSTELFEVVEFVETTIKNIYGSTVEITLDKTAFSKSERYQIFIPSQIAKQVLLDAEIMQFDQEGYLDFVSGISDVFVQEQSVELSFLRGAFVGAFSCNINVEDTDKKNSSGYHAEFVFSRQQFAQDFCFLLADFDIISKMTPRGNSFVVYVKGLDMVSDLLTLVGATQGMLKLQNIGVYRAIKNNINRQNNCLNANLSKTIDASLREVEAIKKIQNELGLDALEKPLQDVAKLRLEHPEESLDELVKLSSQKISKSGMYHRLKKIEKIASKLDESAGNK